MPHPRYCLWLPPLLLLIAALSIGLGQSSQQQQQQQPECPPVADSCAALQLRVSEAAANLTGCMCSAARPFVLCHRCAAAYAKVRAAHEDLLACPHCARYLLESDSVQVLVRTRAFGQSVWQDGGCELCLQPEPASGYRPDVADFLSSSDRLRACFAKFNASEDSDPGFNGSSEALCRDCRCVYADVNARYQRLPRDQQRCMDALDALNVSRRMWGEKFRCNTGAAPTEPLPLVAAAYIVAVLFYVGARGQGEIAKRRLLRQKRLLGGPAAADVPGPAEPVMSTNASA